MVAPLGRVYTPTPLAQRLAALALAGWNPAKTPRICDPACGDGALLRAVRERRRDAALFGVDLDPEALRASRNSLGRSAQLHGADSLTHVWRDRSFDIVVANPPWVSFSGRHAAALTPQRRTELRERFELFRSWPSLHAAFVQLAVRIASWRVAILLPAQVCDLERYAPVRSYLRAHGRLQEPALSLGEDAFEGVVQPSCILVLDRSVAPGEQGGHPIRMGMGRGEGEDYPAALDALPKPPAGLFGDIGVHTGNCARALIGDRGVPVREGRDISPFQLGEPRKRYRDDYTARQGEYFRASPLQVYRDVPIVLRQTASQPIAALHDDPTYFRNSVLACRGLPGVDDAVLVAWLNHPWIAAYHRTKVREAGQRAFPQLKMRHLRDLPMPDLARAPVRELAREVARNGRVDLRPELEAALSQWLPNAPPVPRVG